MATIKSIYKGDLSVEMTHIKSGTTIATDAPTDNHGKGESFSPTDLVAAALGGCILTIMGIAARNRGVNIDDTTFETTKIMTEAPRRIGEIVIDFHFPSDYEPGIKRALEAAARECPVARSLHPDIKQTLTFNYGE